VAEPASTGQSADGTATGGPVTTSPSDTGPDVTIPLSEHERAIAEERRRRAGQERTHQREKGELLSRLEALESRIAASPVTTGVPSANVEGLIQRLEAGENSPALLRDGLAAVAAWSQYLSNQERTKVESQSRQQAVSETIEALQDEFPDVVIPRTSLDLTSPESVRASAREYVLHHQVSELTRQVAELKKGTTAAQEDAAMTETRVRQQLGATRTSTSLGEQPQMTLSESEEELAQLRQDAARLKRLHKGDELMSVNRRIAELQGEVAIR
jgi:hypothetical protein